MQRLKDTIRRVLLCMVALFLLASYPVMASAQTVDPGATSPTTTTKSETPAAPEAPVPPKRTYTYDSGSGRWNSEDWTYDAASGTYIPTPKPVHAGPPAAAANEPDVSATTTGGSDTNANATIGNTVTSTAQTGNANVTGNTTAGNATSGNAQAAATVFNNVLSSIGGSTNPQVATFVTNIVGDVYGDIMLYPTMIKGVLDSINPMDSSVNSTSQATVNNNTAIENNVDLNAASGNANVTGNTTAGNATSGNAVAMANIVNMINSIITANKSFAGTINIYGNLDGDILVSPDFIPQLLASNGGTMPDSLQANITDNQSIINNVNLNASSGNAGVTHNTTAGNATTGSAGTNLVILNMTGRQVVASNSLLVFVNVLGSWVGLIVDAPVGSTAAAYGNGVLSNSAADTVGIDATNSAAIVNNINLNAETGDALVANNTTAGNATSGNAIAAANIVNINGTTFNLSDWFGLLFINVFGSWHGSFGVDTANGNTLAPTASTAANGAAAPGAPAIGLQFIPTTSSVIAANAVTAASDEQLPPPVNDNDSNSSNRQGVVAAAATSRPSSGTPASAATTINAIMLSGVLIIVGLSLAFGRQIYGFIAGRNESLAESA